MRNPANPDAIVKVASKLDAGVNAIAEIAIAASEQEFWELLSIHCSYSGAGTPSGGSLIVEFGGSTVVLSQMFEVKKDGEFLFPRGLVNSSLTKNEAMVVGLEAGGVNTTAKLNITYR